MEKEEAKEEAVEERQEIKEEETTEIQHESNLYQTIKSLIWLWVTLLIITILSVAYFLLKKIRKL